MALAKEWAVSNQEQLFQRYLFPITIISSIFISALTGFTASKIVVNNSVGDPTEVKTMKNQVNEARNNSLKVIETEIPKIISDLDKYNQDINILVDNVEWLKGNLATFRDLIGIFDSAITVAKGVNTLVKLPVVGNISNKLEIAQSQLNEIDSVLSGLENLTVIEKEMSDSHQKINTLFKKYQKEKSIELLFQVEQELNSNLIYQIEDLRNTTIETNKAFELSSSILITVINIKSLCNSMKEIWEITLETIQLKENKGRSADI